MKFDTYVTTYLKIRVKGKSIALWRLKCRDYWPKKHGNLHFLRVNWTKLNLTLVWHLIWSNRYVEGNLIALWGLENRNFWAKTRGNCHFLRMNWINAILPLFDPLFKVTGRKKLDRPKTHEDLKMVILGQKHMPLFRYSIG